VRADGGGQRRSQPVVVYHTCSCVCSQEVAMTRAARDVLPGIEVGVVREFAIRGVAASSHQKKANWWCPERTNERTKTSSSYLEVLCRSVPQDEAAQRDLAVVAAVLVLDEASPGLRDDYLCRRTTTPKRARPAERAATTVRAQVRALRVVRNVRRPRGGLRGRHRGRGGVRRGDRDEAAARPEVEGLSLLRRARRAAVRRVPRLRPRARRHDLPGVRRLRLHRLRKLQGPRPLHAHHARRPRLPRPRVRRRKHRALLGVKLTPTSRDFLCDENARFCLSEGFCIQII